MVLRTDCVCGLSLLTCVWSRTKRYTRTAMNGGDERIADELGAMARALAGGAPDGDAVTAAEERARAALIEKIKSMPPKAAFSKAALQAFKQQHVAMMSYTEGSSSNGSQPAS
jgi:hypothetical protein